MDFKKLIETRFADPVTTIDLSNNYVCIGSAMGRISFYDIQNDKNQVFSDSQPEIVRGISHSESGDKIYVSIGDIFCHIFEASTLNWIEKWVIVDDVDMDGQIHRNNCEKAYTMTYKHYNCILAIQLSQGKSKIYQYLFYRLKWI